MRHRQIGRLTALIIALMLALSACNNRGNTISEEDAALSLPEPEAAQPHQILGDNTSATSGEVTLYFPVDGSYEMTAVTRTLNTDSGENLYERALRELLSSSENVLLGASGTQLAGLELGAGVATVRLSIDAAVNRTDQDYLMICTAIANTLLGMEGLEAVNILAGERSYSLENLPIGVFTVCNENVAASYAQIQAEGERFGDGNSFSLSRQALIYFPAQGGKYLLPEVRQLEFDSEDYAQVLLEALMAGPETLNCCFSPIPNDSTLLLSDPKLLVTDTGERVLQLEFSAMLSSYLALAGVEPWQCYGALVLTFSSFIPELDAVHISIDRESVMECGTGNGKLQFPSGLMRRTDFSSRIGGCVQMYFAQQDSSLVRLECATSQSAPLSASGILSEMIAARDSYLPGLESIFPDGISSQDILGTTIEERIAYINLSSNFYACCQALDPQQERLLIYGMINALTELDQIGAVAFLVEGRQIDSLSQNIYLKTALLPDPGLVHAYVAPIEESIS